jgi:hypothetical protein
MLRMFALLSAAFLCAAAESRAADRAAKPNVIVILADDLADSRSAATLALEKLLDAWNATLAPPRWPNPQPRRK